MRVGAIGCIVLVIAAVGGFLIKHTEPPQWELLLARIGVVTAKSIVDGNTGSDTAIKPRAGYSSVKSACAYRDKFKEVSENERNDCGPVANDDLLKVLRDRSLATSPSVAK